MAALSLMVDLEQDLPIKLDLRSFMSVQTIGELTALVAGLVDQSGTAERSGA